MLHPPPKLAPPSLVDMLSQGRTNDVWSGELSAARPDINSFANELLLDFVDAFHQRMKSDLQMEFGEAWLEQGVQRHLDAPSLARARKMLESPMRVVDMDKSDEELYGVEHLGNVVAGNWKTVYSKRLENKERALVYLGEIAEVRHNVSHRRRRHVLRRSEVVRLAQNCAMLLRGVESEEAPRYERLVESLNTGGTPWGTGLAGYLPPQDEVVEEFVGRPDQMRDLTSWLAGERPQLLVWGDGGAGKSALAYEFAREMQVAAPADLNAVCWVSAKRIEFVAGAPRPKRADFIDRESLVKAIFNALYETDIADEDLSEQMLLDQLRELPSLIVVDDFDTVLEDDALVEFLMYDVRSSGSRVLYTSRNKVPGIPHIEVLGFEGEELVAFIRVRAFEHDLDPEPCSQRADAIRSVTGGFPLFIDDLLRYARIDGIKGALEDWSQKKGDAAREYALRRQLERLGETSAGVLIALSVSDRPLTALEMATLAGVADEDAEDAVRNLLSWKLVGRVPTDDEDRPGFSLNLNTRRLVQRTYPGDPRMEAYRARFRTLGSSRVPAARSARTAMAIGHAKALITRGDVEGAITVLREGMTGELARGGRARLDEIEREFGSRVAHIVDGCTDTDISPKPPWRARKKAYVQALASHDASVRRVSLADKLYNARAILLDYRSLGDDLWDRFDPKADQLWYYRALVSAFRETTKSPLVEELDRVVTELEQQA
jgi:hypothetical protein